MIDAFQWFVWPAKSDLHEGFPFGTVPADSPQARRLQCLVAEARAAGVPTRHLFGLLLDWARVLEPLATRDAWRDALTDAIAVTDAAQYRFGKPLSEPMQAALNAIAAVEPTEEEDTGALQVAKLLVSHFAELVHRGGEADPETAWDAALVILSAIARACERDAIESAMHECAQVAHARLFPQRKQ
jgi:hypothetical protein